ncbi:hypothetical protein FRC10_004178 [Ceratobasidium sp. 414]|nr:hypothetical protein FRC10_004178 [Ceratobasidium sp. 414]
MLEVPELLLAILRCLDAPSLSACSQVCRDWYEPSTELMWAQSTKLEYIVSKLIRDDVQSHFRQPLLRYFAMKSHFGLVNTLFGEGQNPGPSEDDIDRALNEFKALPVDWFRETASFTKRIQWTSHLQLNSKSTFPIRIIYILQQCHPAVLRGIFPRLTNLTFSGDLYPSAATHCLTSIPSLRHVTFDMSISRSSLRSWILACEPAVGLTSLAINLALDKVDYAQEALPLNFAYPASPTLCGFLSSRRWKQIELPSLLLGPTLFITLSCLDTLENLTLSGPVRRHHSNILPQGKAFKSLRVLYMQQFSGGEDFFQNITLPNITDLTLDFIRPLESRGHSCPISYLATMARACPNVKNIEVSIPGTQDHAGLSDAALEPLLPLRHLKKLVIRTSPQVAVCISDDLLGRAAQSWPDLEELDIDPAHSHQTLLTLQGLAPLAQHCLNLRSLRLGLRPRHVNTVFSPELYDQMPGGSRRVCALQYLDVGCPSVYGSAAVSTFLSTIFPNLRHIEYPEPGNFELFSEGDHFVWSQVIRMVCDRVDRDIDGLAQMLRAQDLSKKEGIEKGSYHEDLVQSSDYDSDDYWAYSGSEDESYSDSSDE